MAKKPLERRVNKPPISTAPPLRDEVTAFICCSCGNAYPNQARNFYKAQSSLYRGNNGYIPICRDCMEKLYIGYLAVYKDDRVALKTLARNCNIYVNDTILVKVLGVPSEKSKVAELVKAANSATYAGKTYDNTVLEEAERASAAVEYDEEFEVTEEMKARWGTSFSTAEFQQLEAHYNSFAEQRTPDDIVQDKLLIDLSKTMIEQNRCLIAGDTDGYAKMSKLYQDTLKSANFKTIQKSSDLNDASQCWGVFVNNVEHYVPADLYKDKDLFDDVDGILDYLRRHLIRPFKNFFTGSNEQDPEFSITAGDDDDV